MGAVVAAGRPVWGRFVEDASFTAPADPVAYAGW